MKKVLIVGASGVVGLEICKLLSDQNIELRLQTSSREGAERLKKYCDDIFIAGDDDDFTGITRNIDIVISALGNSVSLFTSNDTSFYKTDLYTNKKILEDAKINQVKRFIYISILGAEENEKMSIPGSKRLLERSLENSGIDYSIVRPVGLFSGLHDLGIMAKRKLVPVIGDGKAKTNSMHQADLALFISEILETGEQLIEIGGPETHTRLEMAEMIAERFDAKTLKVPESIAEAGVILSSFSKDIKHKLENFKYITTHDMIGKAYGQRTFKEYLYTIDKNDLP
ncbi:NAD(P)H-binding protein [Christiangramia portivictoriae]|uniref:NAD(P)H-binding protein n=1 Tax=Christiangramia portivictoriae TaxID=326069 RepID=UPI0003F59510|nr:NAD(P)H-binding protein [Christiangramia portivictoriae]